MFLRLDAEGLGGISSTERGFMLDSSVGDGVDRVVPGGVAIGFFRFDMMDSSLDLPLIDSATEIYQFYCS